MFYAIEVSCTANLGEFPVREPAGVIQYFARMDISVRICRVTQRRIKTKERDKSGSGTQFVYTTIIKIKLITEISHMMSVNSAL